MAIRQKPGEPSFWEAMDSCFISICKFSSFKNPFVMITSLSDLYFRFRRFIFLVQFFGITLVQFLGTAFLTEWVIRVQHFVKSFFRGKADILLLHSLSWRFSTQSKSICAVFAQLHQLVNYLFIGVPVQFWKFFERNTSPVNVFQASPETFSFWNFYLL